MAKKAVLWAKTEDIKYHHQSKGLRLLVKAMPRYGLSKSLIQDFVYISLDKQLTVKQMLWFQTYSNFIVLSLIFPAKISCCFLKMIEIKTKYSQGIKETKSWWVSFCSVRWDLLRRSLEHTEIASLGRFIADCELQNFLKESYIHREKRSGCKSPEYELKKSPLSPKKLYFLGHDQFHVPKFCWWRKVFPNKANLLQQPKTPIFKANKNNFS